MASPPAAARAGAHRALPDLLDAAIERLGLPRRGVREPRAAPLLSHAISTTMMYPAGQARRDWRASSAAARR